MTMNVDESWQQEEPLEVDVIFTDSIMIDNFFDLIINSKRLVFEDSSITDVDYVAVS